MSNLKHGSEHKKLTIEELKAFDGCENFTNKEAEEVIQQLEDLSILMFDLYAKHMQIAETSRIDNYSDKPKKKSLNERNREKKRKNAA